MGVGFIIVSGWAKDFENENSFTFNLATNGVPRAAGPIEDLLMAFTARPIKEIALAASESEYKTGIPLDVETLKMLMKNRNLTFKLQKANITAEQQRLFACAEAHLVFDKCSFEESGSFLLGHEFDPRRNRSGMHVVFMFDYPPLEKVSEALDNGWFKSIGFGECDFQAKDIGLLQKLHDASENQGSDFSLGLLSSVTLTVRSQEYGLGNIRNLLRGDPAVSPFKSNLHPLLFVGYNSILIGFIVYRCGALSQATMWGPQTRFVGKLFSLRMDIPKISGPWKRPWERASNPHMQEVPAMREGV